MPVLAGNRLDGPPTNIYTPTILARFSWSHRPRTRSGLQVPSSFSLADSLSAANKRVKFTVGARLQRGQGFRRDDQRTDVKLHQGALNLSVSLVVTSFCDNATFYGNWTRGTRPITIVAPPFANAGDVFPPFKSTQNEAGVKVDWGKFTTTVSIFQITQPFTFANIAANTLVLGGE